MSRLRQGRGPCLGSTLNLNRTEQKVTTATKTTKSKNKTKNKINLPCKLYFVAVVVVAVRRKANNEKLEKIISRKGTNFRPFAKIVYMYINKLCINIYKNVDI